MDNLIPSFSASLFDPTIEIGKDALDLGIDAVLEDGLLKDIPIVGRITSVLINIVDLYNKWIETTSGYKVQI